MSMSYVVVCRAWSSSLRCILYETNTCIKRGRSTATWVHSPSSCMIPWPCDLHLVTLTSVQVVDMWPLTGATSQPTLETVQPYPFISVTARFASRLPRTFWFDLWPKTAARVKRATKKAYTKFDLPTTYHSWAVHAWTYMIWIQGYDRMTSKWRRELQLPLKSIHFVSPLLLS